MPQFFLVLFVVVIGVVLGSHRVRLAVAHRFVLRFHTATVPMLKRWRAMLGSTPKGQQVRYQAELLAMECYLAAFDGKPPGAVTFTVPPFIYFWWFDGVLFQFVRAEAPPAARGWLDLWPRLIRLIRGGTTTVTVIGLTPVGPVGGASPPQDSSTD